MTPQEIWELLNIPVVPKVVPNLGLHEGQSIAELSKFTELLHLFPSSSDSEFRNAGFFPEISKLSPTKPEDRNPITDPISSLDWGDFLRGCGNIRSPRTGNVCTSFHSFQMYRDTFYRVVEDNEVFYLICCLTGYRTFYYPKENVVIYDNIYDRSDMHKWSVLSAINRLKDAFVVYADKVRDYIASNRVSKIAVAIGCRQFAHHVWNELPGVQRIIDSNFNQKISRYVVTEQSLGAITSIFPEIESEKLIICKSDYDQFSECLGYFIVRAVSHGIPQILLDRIISHTNRILSQEIKEKISSARLQCFPLLWVNLRYQSRAWKSSEFGISSIVNKLRETYPNIGLIVDGFSYPYGEFGYLEQSIKREKQGIAEISKNIPGVPVFDITGTTMPEFIAWAQIADLYLCTHGSNDHKITWFTQCPGVVHGSKSRMKARGCGPRENYVHPVCISPDAITDNPDGSHDFDWSLAYEALKKIADGLVKR